jgi:anti-sigma regulatory factor (Ser/Thr protein kinase)
MVDTATVPRIASTAHHPVPAVAGQIRRYVRTLLHNWRVAADRVDDALLVVEELVANVVDHAHTRFQLLVRLSGDVLHLAVRDHSARPLELRPFDPHAARGRGLQLVSALALRWGCEQHTDGKTVWAEL